MSTLFAPYNPKVPYFCSNTEALVDMDDSKKLYLLADWLDHRDNDKKYIGPREIQSDLRRIAEKLELEEIKP